jgi:hypothetical protein
MTTAVQQNNNMGYPIYLYTTPTANQNKIWKRTVDIIGHWAICINGYCYELTRVTPSEKESGIEVKYWIRYLPEQEWKRVKQQEGRRITERDPLGYTARPWTHADIKHIGKYHTKRIISHRQLIKIHHSRVNLGWPSPKELRVRQKQLSSFRPPSRRPCRG